MHIPKDQCGALSDQDLVRMALNDSDFFSCLYDRYEDRLLRYIRHFARVSQEDAEDILQDAFIHIWQHLNSYQSHLPLSHWLYRIVHNHTITFLRRRKSYGKDPKAALDDGVLAYAPQEEETPLEREEQWVLTWQLLDQLPLVYREVVVMRYLENMHYDQISDILKIPAGTVAARLSRAKKALQKLWAHTSVPPPA